MLDPTRIDRTLQALKAAWEGQPELPLGTLFAMLANQGLGWGADDADMVRALEQMARLHPPTLPLGDGRVEEGLWLLVTERERVTIGEENVVIRRTGDDGPRQPVAWKYSAVRPVGPGRPLVIKDSEFIEHRFGVVESIIRLKQDSRRLSGLKRRNVGERAWLIRTEQETILLDHGLHAFRIARRCLQRADYSWQQVLQCSPGKPLQVSLSRGVTHEFGAVTEVLLAESAPAIAVDGYID